MWLSNAQSYGVGSVPVKPETLDTGYIPNVQTSLTGSKTLRNGIRPVLFNVVPPNGVNPPARKVLKRRLEFFESVYSPWFSASFEASYTLLNMLHNAGWLDNSLLSIRTEGGFLS